MRLYGVAYDVHVSFIETRRLQMDESTNDKGIMPAFDRDVSPADPEFSIYLFAKSVFWSSAT